MARDPVETASVYDFIYVDARRIGVLLSQLGGGQDGVLTEQTRATSTSSESGGGISVHVAKADHLEKSGLGLTRKFDPQWLQPLLFLDLAQDLISRDLSKSKLGQLVLAKGSVFFHDYTTVMALLQQEFMRKRLANSDKIDWSTAISTLGLADKGGKPLSAAEERKAKGDAVDAMLNVITSMPRRSQMILTGEGGSTWSLLRDDSMIVSCDELSITHGAEMPGEWIIVGVLDATNESISSEPLEEGLLQQIVGDNNQQAQPAKAFINTSTNMNKLVRNAVGRPDGTYAVTPLLIFREVPII